MSEIDEKYITELKEYKKTAEARLKYSIERFDILIISLSSGGLVLGVNLFSSFKCAEKTLISYSWFFFSTALILNLLSQITGYLANKFDISCTDNIIDEVERDLVSSDKEMNETLKLICNLLTYFLNIFSLISLISGIIMLIYFVNNKI